MDIAVAASAEADFARAFGQKFGDGSVDIPVQLWKTAHALLGCLPSGSTLSKWSFGEENDREQIGTRFHSLSLDERVAIIRVNFTPTRFAYFRYALGGVVAEARDALLEKINEVNLEAIQSTTTLEGFKRPKKARALERFSAITQRRQMFVDLEAEEALILALWFATRRRDESLEHFVTTTRAFTELVVLAELPQFASEKDVEVALKKAKSKGLLGRSDWKSGKGSLYILGPGRKMAQAIQTRAYAL